MATPTRGVMGPQPICFMVMPFRRRKVEGTHGPGAPADWDCDRLWDTVLRPVIEELDYLPVRADSETGSVIVKDMLLRLAQAHLVIADVTLPNGNVYYEVGLRHVAQETGCVHVAASWSKQLFDIDQFRSIRYSITNGDIPEDQAKQAREELKAGILRMRQSKSPWHELVTAAPDAAPGLVREQCEEASALQAKMGAIRLAPAGERAARLTTLLAELRPGALVIPEIVCELLVLVRDHAGWAAVVEFAGRLPAATATLPFVEEQRLLALAEAGEPLEAVARLELLIRDHGDTPERRGLIGGRFKRLWRKEAKARQEAGGAQTSADERRYLTKAIEQYTLGMELDYNQYYCSSNLPALLRARGARGDADRAAIVEHFVVAACDRALKRGDADEWLRPTLLGAALRAGDVTKAEDLATQVEAEGGAAWKLEATLADARVAVTQIADADTRASLQAVIERLASV